MEKLLISTILFTLFIPFMLVVTLFFNRDLVHSAQNGYITVESGGQLGNQMFDIATVLAYAHNHNLKPIFPNLNTEFCQSAYNRDHIFFRLDSSECPFPLTVYRTNHPNYSKLPNNLNNVIITGGFFSWRYFHNNRDLIVAAFEPSKVVIEKLQKKYDDLLQSNQTVAVHVRSYSKQVHDAGLHFVGFQYFEDAMKKFPDNYTFVVFSDRTNWCKANFQKRFPNKKLVFIEGNDHIEDLFLMSFMKHQILSKSTYSWWAGYLNKNPNKVVIAPHQHNLLLSKSYLQYIF